MFRQGQTHLESDHTEYPHLDVSELSVLSLQERHDTLHYLLSYFALLEEFDEPLSLYEALAAVLIAEQLDSVHKRVDAMYDAFDRVNENKLANVRRRDISTVGMLAPDSIDVQTRNSTFLISLGLRPFFLKEIDKVNRDKLAKIQGEVDKEVTISDSEDSSHHEIYAARRSLSDVANQSLASSSESISLRSSVSSEDGPLPKTPQASRKGMFSGSCSSIDSESELEFVRSRRVNR